MVHSSRRSSQSLPHARSEEATRDAIIAGARVAFARRGRAATMADVAAAAGVSQGLAYRYFDGKEALYAELIEQAVQRGRAVLEPLRHARISPGERLRMLLTTMIEMRTANPEEFRLLDEVVAEAPHDEGMRRRRAEFLDLLGELVVAAQAAGELTDDDPDQLVIAIAATLEGLTRFAVHYPERYRSSPPRPEIFLRLLPDARA